MNDIDIPIELVFDPSSFCTCCLGIGVVYQDDEDLEGETCLECGGDGQIIKN